MSKKITFSLDLEDHRPDENLPKRYLYITEKILEFLDERKIKATVFTVGSLAEKDPELVRNIHSAGHEIAHHSYNHITLNKQSLAEFREDTSRAKGILEDITGEAVQGYRAPVFSLTRQTSWAVDILKELDFVYSSSVLPASNPLHGFSGVPKEPFKWSNGLLEIPAPVGCFGPVVFPYLGGFYFRYFPMSVVKRQINQANDDSALWTYCHPYDFDWQEKNWKIKGASVPVSLLLWFNRRYTFKKMDKLSDFVGFDVPFCDQTFGGNLEIVDPLTL